MSKVQFGTGGFRGIVGQDFNKENVQLISQGIANLVKQNNWIKYPIVIGYDNRMESENSAIWISDVLNGNGIKTYIYTHSVPTPMVMLATMQNKSKLGIMITASHNPYTYNGMKVFKEGGFDADVELTSAIEKLIPEQYSDVITISNDQAKREELTFSFSNDKEYHDFLAKFLCKSESGREIDAYFDSMHGTAHVSLCKAIDLVKINHFEAKHIDRDITFGYKVPNPTKRMLGEEFFDTVKKYYDLGLATDSDGDRLGVSDENGNYVTANEMLASLYYYLIKYRGMKGDIVRNIATSNLLDLLAGKFGYKCHECDVGFKNITSTMVKYDALLGGECSGGLTIRNYINGKDSTFSGSLFIEMASTMNKPVSEIIKEVKDFAGYNSYFIEDEIVLKLDKNLVFDYIKKHQPVFDEEITSSKELGLNYKWYFGDNWMLIRLSGTEPIFRIFVECHDEKLARQLIKQLDDYVNQAQEILLKK